MNKKEPTAMERTAKSYFELTAMRGSALALNQSDYEVTKRLESAYDQITLMLELLHDQSSTETLNKICGEIDRLIEKLTDTVTIARLVIRERELELKLAELDKKINPSIKDKIIQTFRPALPYDLPVDKMIDPETRQRIEERLQLESLIDSLHTNETAERVKKMLQRELRDTTRRESVEIRLPRPYRDLDAQVPTSKGKGYELPDTHHSTEE